MAQTKNALIRYKTIDKCLQNSYRKWSLQDLITACSDALYEYEGRDIDLSKRTVQLDLQMMRSDKLGYNAPIEVYERKYYRYADADYSITNIPVTEHDMKILGETVEMLKQFKDFSLFDDLAGVIQRLEDTVYTEQMERNPIIHLDKNDRLRGLNYLDMLYQAILHKICVDILYKSFKAREGSSMIFHPYILKEYNNRWFVVGRVHGRPNILTLALDRMESVLLDLSKEYKMEDFDSANYYKNTIGVTVLGAKSLYDISIWIDRMNAPYILTKPLHSSQILLEKRDDGSIVVQIKVHHNYELERLVLGFGDSMEVISPRIVRRNIYKKLQRASKRYAVSQRN